MKKKKIKKKVTRKKKPARRIKKKVTSKPRKRVVKGKKKKTPKPKKSSKISAFIPAGASLEEIGIVTHYFPHVDAAVIKLTKGSLSQGDSIILKGHTTDFKEKIISMQLDHVPITSASKGQEIGLKVKSRVREHDVVYRVIA